YYATALGNMFRHKGRLVLTQVVLVAAGSAFLMIMSLNSSLALTLDNFFATMRYDISIGFNGEQRVDQILAAANRVPGVVAVETRLVQQANIFMEEQRLQEAGLSTTIWGIPEGSDFFEPKMVAGRWFVPGDGRALVIGRETAQDNHIQVGDMVTLDLGTFGKESWQVVGLYEPVFVGGFASSTIYAPEQEMIRVTGASNRAGRVQIRATQHDDAFTTELTKNLKEAFERHAMRVSGSQTQLDLRATNEWQFSIVTSMLLGLSIILAVVGAFSLMGVISIGVIERTKEIGVLRAIGARSRTILRIFVMEGVLQGVLSWMIAVPLSILVSPSAAYALGHAMFGATLDYRYNWPAVFIWLGIVIVISVVASIMPARGATRISVRDSLAYA
ncbi:MAG TPA: FtsX-like permease family protein, partial [Anaerolineales bacterium]